MNFHLVRSDALSVFDPFYLSNAPLAPILVVTMPRSKQMAEILPVAQ